MHKYQLNWYPRS